MCHQMPPHPHRADTITTSHFKMKRLSLRKFRSLPGVSQPVGIRARIQTHAFFTLGKNKRRPELLSHRSYCFHWTGPDQSSPRSFFFSLSPCPLHLDEDPGGRKDRNRACTSESRVVSTQPDAELLLRSVSILPCSVLTVPPGVVWRWTLRYHGFE